MHQALFRHDKFEIAYGLLYLNMNILWDH